MKNPLSALLIGATFAAGIAAADDSVLVAPAAAAAPIVVGSEPVAVPTVAVTDTATISSAKLDAALVEQSAASASNGLGLNEAEMTAIIFLLLAVSAYNVTADGSAAGVAVNTTATH